MLGPNVKNACIKTGICVSASLCCDWIWLWMPPQHSPEDTMYFSTHTG